MRGRQAIWKDDDGMLIVTYNGTDFVERVLGNPQYTKEDLEEIKENLDAKFWLQKSQ